MGRKPNPLILEYFERGPKLNDKSNRYPHTCRLCGENFPKGRIDNLTAHITKRCPAISESERMHACLELHGIAHARTAAERHQLVVGRGNPPATPSSSTLPQEWSALETLAEASRQVDLNENSRSPNSHNPANPAAANGAQSDYRFDLNGQFRFESPPMNYDVNTHDRQQTEEAARGLGSAVAPGPTPPPPADLTPEERLQALLPVREDSPDNSNLSVAVAAAARLNSSFFDPQLVNSQDRSSASPPPSEAPAASHEIPAASYGAADGVQAGSEAAQTASLAPVSGTSISQPWGEMTYLTTTPVAAVNNIAPSPTSMPMVRGGVRMDTSGPLFNGRARHSRSKFTAARRQEVKEVRKLGACIRCRILRKICSKGTPCDTCRKVLAPKVWMTGCVRSRLHEQLDLYSAGVQVVLSQNRINLHKDQLDLIDVDSVVHVSHFPDSGKHISLPTLAVLLEPDADRPADFAGDVYHVVMVNQDKEDVPSRIDAYVRDVLELFVEREPSRFMRVTLGTAMQQLAEAEDELLRKALELWGLVESIDRERQWTIVERPAGEDQKPRPIKEAQSENDVDIYTMICMQLNAAAERKASSTSKALLNLMDRQLADSKNKAGFSIYLAALILLNCVEKSTWAFKAWEQDHLRPGWPLERDPGAFTQKGGHLAALFKMLLSIRRALPQTLRADDGKLATLDPDPAVASYFQRLDVEYDTVQTRQRGSEFFPADSRSLELMLCSHLLLPSPAP